MAAIVYQKNKITGVTYVYESSSYWDKEKQQSRAKRKCIGKLDPTTGQLIPNVKVDSDSEQLPKKRGPKPVTIYKRTFYGATYLLEAIGQLTGVASDLKCCFPDTYKQILSLVYYLVLEEANSMSRFTRWASMHYHPWSKDIPSQRISELFQSISKEDKQQFFLLQGKRRIEREYLAYDTTSVSSYSRTLKQIKYGKNKEHNPLPQLNLALLFGEESRLPVCYRKLPGNISDVKTIQNLLDDMDFLEIKKVNLVMDRGFYSEDNINELYKNHHKFLIGAKLSLKLVKTHLEESRTKLSSRSNYSSKYELYYDSVMTEWNYTETKKRSGSKVKDTRRIYLHLHYNDARASEDRMSFNRMLDMLEYELMSGKRNPDHERQYAKYYTIKETPSRGIALEPKQDAIDEAEENFGYFALLSNGIKEPLKALEIYRSKDLIEKGFGNLKERLNMRRYYVSSEESLEGKIFVQFVALIYLSYIKKTMSDNNLYKRYTMQEFLDELDVIERYEKPGHRHRISEITQKQKDLYRCFQVEVPT
ncbi:MAG: IS1634 family transposase [Bacillota bacterium]